METYYKLNNFPKNIIQDFLQCWTDNKWEKVVDTYKGRNFKYNLAKSNIIYKNFVGCSKIEFYQQPAGGVGLPHQDRHRLCAVNIPIEVDYSNSYFFIGKSFDQKKYKQIPVDRKSKETATSMYMYDDKKMLKYNLEKPIVFDTNVPHGGSNTESNTRRIIASVTYLDYTYEQVLNMLPPEWF